MNLDYKLADVDTSRIALDGAETRRLLELLSELSMEMGRRPSGPLLLDTSLVDRLGIDSLGRLELSLRIERAFDVSLAEEAVLLARTPRELLHAIESARKGGGISPREETEGSRKGASSAAASDEPAVPSNAQNLGDVLEWYAERSPYRVHATLLGDGKPRDLTYGELLLRARRVVQGLGARGVGPGQTVGLMLPTGTDYLASFMGVNLIGAIPVPVYPPLSWDGVEGHLDRQGAILANAGVGALILPRAASLAGRLLQGRVPGLEHLLDSESLCDYESANAVPPRALPAPGDLALLQYTSGSTSFPKGVMLSHGNLLANIRAIARAQRLSARDVIVSWLPLYHDMGLIGAWLSALYCGARAVILTPQSFLARPQNWLRAIHDYGGTASTAPNFAYEICASRLRDEDLEGLDLSTWTKALNGAESVSPRTVRRFTDRFSSAGFRAEAMTPVYGLAENSVAVTMPRTPRLPPVDVIDRRRLQNDGSAVPLPDDHADALAVVGCGPVLDGHELRVVDENELPCPDRKQGRIQFRGESATSGYFRNPEATSRLFRNGWLETGDLGYLVEGELYVTGRSKDLIIRGGRNLHPQELEEIVGDLEGVRKGCVAAFGCLDEGRGTERLVVVAETRRPPDDYPSLVEATRAALRPLLQGEPDEVVLIPPRAIPKTSSGKIRRGECKERYLTGTLIPTPSGWTARAHLLMKGLTAQVSASAASLGVWLYAARFWLILHAFMAFGWCLVLVTPGVARRRRILRFLTGLSMRLSGIPVQVHGREHLAGPCLAVANHQGYLDTIVMSSLASDDFFFTPKRDLEDHLVPRLLLRRLDYQFVDRLDPKTGVADLEAVKRRLREGQSAVVYPEGIFYAEPGLRHFYTGAFTVAAETGTKVVPVAIAGARAIWRGEKPFARRGSVTVTIGPPLVPAGSDWESVVGLRQQARDFIAARCGEPDVTG